MTPTTRLAPLPLLALCLLTPFTALALGPPAGDAAATSTTASTITPAKALETINKAAQAQGDISPLTVKALQNDPRAMEAINRANQTSGQPNGQSGGQPSGQSGGQQGKKTGKAIYGDIIIHK